MLVHIALAMVELFRVALLEPRIHQRAAPPRATPPVMNETSATESRSNNNQSEESQDGDTIESENSSSSKLSKRDGPATINQRVKNGAIERQRESTAASETPSNQSREKEQAIESRLLRDESWHAKLPPELRKSIRAGVGQKPPRAYEERLKKYFQSVD